MSTEISEKTEDLKKEGWEIKEIATKFVIFKNGNERLLLRKEDDRVIKLDAPV